MESKRLLTDIDGTVWLRIEDAGYMDSEGNIWLVGRVKWRVERNGRTHWSIVVEQKVSCNFLQGSSFGNFCCRKFVCTAFSVHVSLVLCLLQVLDRCSLVTFAAYLPHNGEAWLFLEAPKGLPDKEKAGMSVSHI